MTSCHLHSETRIYCEFRENKSQVANWSKAKPFQMASLRSFWNAVTKTYAFRKSRHSSKATPSVVGIPILSDITKHSLIK